MSRSNSSEINFRGTKAIFKKAVLFVFCLLFASAVLAGCYSTADITEVTPMRGSIEGNTYTSEFGDLKFEKPDDWVFETDEEIEETIGAIMADGNGIDMIAYNKAMGSGVMVMYQDLELNIDDTQITEEQYIKIIISELDGEFSDIVQKELGGETYTMCTSRIPDYGVEQGYYVRKIGEYMLSIVINTFEADDVSTIAGCFS
jgi:hypothetical protein